VTKQWIGELTPGETLHTAAQIREIRLLPFKEKPGFYLSLKLGDRTGELEAKVWDGAEGLAAAFKLGDVVEVEGQVSEYRGRTQLKVKKLTAGPEFKAEYFLPVSPRNREKMAQELQNLILAVSEPNLQRLLATCFEGENIWDRFCLAPAAKKNHQAYLGGLLEHTLNVARLAEALAERTPGADRDLTLTGAILHDLGKIREFAYDRLIDYTVEGRLLGHILLGSQMVQRVIDSLPEFPEGLAVKILHIIASHHGEYQWQSPKRPKFLEAFLIHQADLIDAETFKFQQVEGEAMQYSRELERYVLPALKAKIESNSSPA